MSTDDLTNEKVIENLQLIQDQIVSVFFATDDFDTRKSLNKAIGAIANAVVEIQRRTK